MKICLHEVKKDILLFLTCATLDISGHTKSNVSSCQQPRIKYYPQSFLSVLCLLSMIPDVVLWTQNSLFTASTLPTPQSHTSILDFSVTMSHTLILTLHWPWQRGGSGQGEIPRLHVLVFQIFNKFGFLMILFTQSKNYKQGFQVGPFILIVWTI